MPGTSSSADTKCISDVPGLPKQTSTPESTRLRISDCAPFMAAQSRASRGTATRARGTCFSSRRDAWGQGFGETVAAQCRGVCRRAGVHARQRGSRSRRNRASAQLQRARQRRAGVRHRAGAGRADVARERAGKTVATQPANALGGLLFRNVTPGSGYRVRLAAGGRDVRAADGALDAAGAAEHRRLQPDDPLRRLRLPDHPRRHEARRSTCTRRPDVTNVVPGVDLPPDSAGTRADPDADRVLGLRLRQPGRPAERDRGPREPDGLHGRRRQHARHRLLGRRLRLLRAAAEPRRLRRDRDDRPPAVGRCTTRSG